MESVCHDSHSPNTTNTSKCESPIGFGEFFPGLAYAGGTSSEIRSIIRADKLMHFFSIYVPKTQLPSTTLPLWNFRLLILNSSICTMWLGPSILSLLAYFSIDSMHTSLQPQSVFSVIGRLPVDHSGAVCL